MWPIYVSHILFFSESKLTSFECYNLILKGLVEELIELGANPCLKVVAFQLWASYLKRGQIAFFSKTKGKIPALPVGFKSRFVYLWNYRVRNSSNREFRCECSYANLTYSDAEALYGVPNLRKTFFREIFSWRKHRKTKKPKIEDEYDSDSSASSKSSLRHKQVTCSFELGFSCLFQENCRIIKVLSHL